MPRELIDTGHDKRYVRRNAKGQFKEVVDVGKSLAQDRRKAAKRKVRSGERRPGRSQTLAFSLRRRRATLITLTSVRRPDTTTASQTRSSRDAFQPRRRSRLPASTE